ncbi:MAG: preprotein translocase subunit SecY [Firmicutes bacterium]|nr:preprotein translocase subunit SecY [Bacillota bacterium]
MLQTLKNALAVKDIRTKIFNMLVVLVIVRLGTHIPVPGLNMATLKNVQENGTLFQLITGGNYGTIFAMGIGPYITASIIMQLLTVAIPALEEMQKDGEIGRKKISQITRFVTVALALLQGAGQVYTIHTAFTNDTWFVRIVALLLMMSGTVFVMWLGEKLTEVGIGNGASFIIFANILSGLKNAAMSLYASAADGGAAGWAIVAAILGVLVVVMVFVIFINDGERRVPVQYSKKLVGARYMGGNNSFIPIKVNIAGVMSIIFAISLLQFPQTINQLIHSNTLTKISNILSTRHIVGAIVYVLLIFAFTFFYTSFAFNSVEVAENMKKSGGFVPGIRPGKPTSDYIQKIVDRISLIGAFAYAIIAMVPVVLEWLTGIQMGFGGTTLLIVAGVALEIVKQLESQLVNRNYSGFLKS